MKKIVIAGGTGLVGKALSSNLTAAGYEIWQLSTSQKTDSSNRIYHWNPAKNIIPPEALEGADTIINLSGAGIANKPWTKNRRKLLLHSRTQSTRLLVKCILDNNYSPQHFINASAIGYYGNRPGEKVDEATSPGSGFLSWVCTQWEKETEALVEAKITYSILRFGIILSPKGGSLPKLLAPLRLGINAVLGSGKQYISWVHIHDVVKIIQELMAGKIEAGVYNVVAPGSTTLANFNETALAVMQKKALRMRIPAFVLTTFLGELSSIFLNDQQVIPRKLQDQHFNFTYPELSLALQAILVRP